MTRATVEVNRNVINVINVTRATSARRSNNPDGIRTTVVT